jgi:hypothetical protein
MAFEAWLERWLSWWYLLSASHRDSAISLGLGMKQKVFNLKLSMKASWSSAATAGSQCCCDKSCKPNYSHLLLSIMSISTCFSNLTSNSSDLRYPFRPMWSQLGCRWEKYAPLSVSRLGHSTLIFCGIFCAVPFYVGTFSPSTVGKCFSESNKNLYFYDMCRK